MVKNCEMPTILKSSISVKISKPTLLRPGEIKASEDIWNKWFSLSWSSVVILQQNYYPSCYSRQSWSKVSRHAAQRGIRYIYRVTSRTQSFTHFSAVLHQFLSQLHTRDLSVCWMCCPQLMAHSSSLWWTFCSSRLLWYNSYNRKGYKLFSFWVSCTNI